MRTDNDRLIQFLASTRLFGSLETGALNAIEPKCQRVLLHGGDVLFTQGDSADCMYVVVSGRLRVLISTSEGFESEIDELAIGESVGELALISDRPRSATVRAIRDTELLCLSRTAFEQILRDYPGVAMGINRVIVDRLYASRFGYTPPSRAKGIALLPLFVEADIADRLGEGVAAELGQYGSVYRVTTGSTFGVSKSKGAQELNRLPNWISQHEPYYDFILYQCDARHKAWTNLCLRQADKVLIAVKTDQSMSANFFDFGESSLLDKVLADRELLLIHPGSTERPAETQKWLRQWGVETHHHLRLGHPEDLQRLARRISSNAIGVVLSGGGARGFAHIGALRALREASVPIDLIGGTSMGAVIAAQNALGWSYDEMLAKNRLAWIDAKPLRDYTLPFISVIRGRRMMRALKMLFGDTRAEDLLVNFFCVSTNISDDSLAVHRNGELWRLVGSSISVPGFAPPCVIGSALHVDGAVLNNLPTDVMLKLNPGRIIVSDVARQERMAPVRELGEYPSGLRLLVRRTLHSNRPDSIGSLHEVLWRCLTLASSRARRRAHEMADLVLSPPVQHYKSMQFTSLDCIAEIGYNYTQEQLPRIRECLGIETTST